MIPKPGLSPAFGVLPELGLYAVPNGATIELRDLDDSGPLSRLVPLSPQQQAARGGFL